jgi:hypothetical protein
MSRFAVAIYDRQQDELFLEITNGTSAPVAIYNACEACGIFHDRCEEDDERPVESKTLKWLEEQDCLCQIEELVG